MLGKLKLYKTAQAKISCATLKQGDFVAIEFSHVAGNGTAWFKITANQHGKLSQPTIYPQHHLENFCL